jgi:O-acetyl-ADP-ribose deacetylase (regulator of RNase III)
MPSSVRQTFAVKEAEGDLFSSDEAICHCVSRCLHMGAGIAVRFKKLFGRVDELKSQDAPVGGMCFIKDERRERFVYYLVTKQRYFHKPTYESLKQSLECMKNHALEHGVAKISMPRIGCGLDGLEWDRVKRIVGEVFAGAGIQITVYSVPAAAAKSSRIR